MSDFSHLKCIIIFLLLVNAPEIQSFKFSDNLLEISLPPFVTYRCNSKGIQDKCKPRHINLAYTKNIGEMAITWSTYDKPWNDQSLVRYSTNEEDLKQTGNSINVKTKMGNYIIFNDLHIDYNGNQPGISELFIHRVLLQNLIPGQIYYYQCQSGGDHQSRDKSCVSSMYNFTISHEGQKTLKIAIFGDLGAQKGQIVPLLTNHAVAGKYDAVINGGDLAYEFDTNCSNVGDAYMQNFEPVSALVPTMICPGNHDARFNFWQMKSRFTMPEPFSKSLFYSWNLGLVHFISINTEFYYTPPYFQLIEQYHWLVQDLKEANAQRKIRPWIILYGHQPMYCSNNGGDDCALKNCAVRTGFQLLGINLGYGLEQLLYENGVDLAFWGHEHSYERLLPLYDNKVMNGSVKEPYRNPGATVHIITGAAGNQYEFDKFNATRPEWSAFRNDSIYGFSRINILNETHLLCEFVSVNDKVLDSVTLIRDKHEPFSKADHQFNIDQGGKYLQSMNIGKEKGYKTRPVFM